MKNYILSSLLLLFCLSVSFTAHAQTFDFKWANTSEKVYFNDFEIDNNGNCYVVGSFYDTVDLDFGPGTALLVEDTTGTIANSFIAKYDNAGNFVFGHQLHAGDQIALDNNGDIWTAGRFANTVDFDPGPGTHTLTSYQEPGSLQISDIFLAKYDNNGNYLLAFAIVDSTRSTRLEDITTDNVGNVLITGNFRETVDFDPSNASTKLTANEDNGDPFLVKYDATGNLVYANHLVAINDPADGYEVRTDNNNNAYICGRFIDKLDLDPTANTYILNTNGGIDGFVAKYDAGGAFLYGGNFHGTSTYMDVQPNGDFYLAGTMIDTMDVDFGPGTVLLTTSRSGNTWFAHYDQAGSFLSANTIEENGNYFTTKDLLVLPQQGLLLSAQFEDTVDCDPGNPGGEFISKGNKDAIVVKFDNNSDFKVGMPFGANANLRDAITHMDGNNTGDFWICGTFGDSIDFDPSSNVDMRYGPYSSTSTYPRGTFLAKYNDPSVVSSVKNKRKELLDVGITAFNKTIYVDFSNLEIVDAQIEVYNSNGQVILKQSHKRNDRLAIPMRSFSEQIYFVHVRNKNAVRVGKVLLR